MTTTLKLDDHTLEVVVMNLHNSAWHLDENGNHAAADQARTISKQLLTVYYAQKDKR